MHVPRQLVKLEPLSLCVAVWEQTASKMSDRVEMEGVICMHRARPNRTTISIPRR